MFNYYLTIGFFLASLGVNNISVQNHNLKKKNTKMRKSTSEATEALDKLQKLTESTPTLITIFANSLVSLKKLIKQESSLCVNVKDLAVRKSLMSTWSHITKAADMKKMPTQGIAIYAGCWV